MILLASGDANILLRWSDALHTHAQVAQVDNAQRLATFLENRQPDLLMVHVALPGLARMDGLARLKQRYAKCRMLVLSDVPNEGEGLSALRVGCEGYANTYIKGEILAKAVDLVLHGEIWVGRQLMQGILGRTLPVSSGRSPLDKLTRREREVASLVAEGASNRQIAEKILVTERTVKAHLTEIFRKTGTKDRVQLALKLNRQTILREVGQN